MNQAHYGERIEVTCGDTFSVIYMTYHYEIKDLISFLLQFLEISFVLIPNACVVAASYW